MATHPTMDALADASATKGILDGDLVLRRKDEQTSGYMDDIEAVKAEMRRAGVEGRAPDLRPFTTTAIGAAGVYLETPKTEKDVPVVVDASDPDRSTATPAPATLPAQRVEVVNAFPAGVKEANDAETTSPEIVMAETDDEGKPTKKAVAARKKASAEFVKNAQSQTSKAPPTGASNEAPQVNPKKKAKAKASLKK